LFKKTKKLGFLKPISIALAMSDYSAAHVPLTIDMLPYCSCLFTALALRDWNE